MRGLFAFKSKPVLGWVQEEGRGILGKIKNFREGNLVAPGGK